MKNSQKTNATTMDDSTSSTEPNGYSYIFQGYNVLTSNYPADVNSAIMGIGLIDVKDPDNVDPQDYNDITYDLPYGVELLPVGKTSAYPVSGSGESDYSSALAATVGIEGSYGMFKGSASAGYTNMVTTESTYYYTTCIEVSEEYTLGFGQGDVDKDGSNDDLNLVVTDALIDAFADLEIDEDGSNAQSFFSKWGTHVISGITMGGQTNYEMYGSTSDFDDQGTFQSSAEASYMTVSGSVGFEASVDCSTSNVKSNGSVIAVGGSTEAKSNVTNGTGSADDFTAWLNSIPGNEDFYGFTNGGLLLLSDLCTIDETKEYLENVYNQLTGVDIVIPIASNDDQSTMEYMDSPGAMSGDYQITVADESKSSYTHTWEGNANEVLVGIGMNCNSDHRLSKMVVIALDMENQEYNQYFYHDDNNSANESTAWQAFGMAPQGEIITGFAMSQKSQSLSDLIIFTQKVQLTDQDGNYLNSTVNNYKSSASDSQVIDFTDLTPYFGTAWASKGGGSTIDDFNRSATINFPPEDGNTLAINGFSAHSAKDSSPNKGFDYLTTNFTKLVLEKNGSVTTDAVKAKK